MSRWDERPLRFLAGLDAPRSLARHVRLEPRAGFLVRRPSRAAPGTWSTGGRVRAFFDDVVSFGTRKLR
jgi:hypothetical protein